LLFTLVYLLTGSLLWPIVLHVATDVTGGTIGYRVLQGAKASASC
jgi:membrane protease YdiL (CAAX protease family)